MDLTALAHQDQGLNDDGEPLGEADTEVREGIPQARRTDDVR